MVNYDQNREGKSNTVKKPIKQKYVNNNVFHIRRLSTLRKTHG